MDQSFDDQVRLFQKVKSELGLNANTDVFVKRFNEIDKGLTQEDEFLFLLGWSGRCRHFNKLDQSLLLPGSKENYTVPDVIAVIDIEGEPKPFLIEIKTTTEKTGLKWTQKYYEGLINYSKLFNVPLLIAWKWSILDIWTLFEIRHFESHPPSYKISLENAHKYNLMSKFFGDYVVFLAKDLTLNVKHRKMSKIAEQGDTTTWNTVTEDIYYTITGDERIDDLNSGVFHLLLSLATEVHTEDHEDYILNRYYPFPNTSSFAQSIPIRLAKGASETDVNWIDRIRNGNYPAAPIILEKALREGIKSKLVERIIYPIPADDWRPRD